MLRHTKEFNIFTYSNRYSKGCSKLLMNIEEKISSNYFSCEGGFYYWSYRKELPVLDSIYMKNPNSVEKYHFTGNNLIEIFNKKEYQYHENKDLGDGKYLFTFHKNEKSIRIVFIFDNENDAECSGKLMKKVPQNCNSQELIFEYSLDIDIAYKASVDGSLVYNKDKQTVMLGGDLYSVKKAIIDKDKSLVQLILQKASSENTYQKVIINTLKARNNCYNELKFLKIFSLK
jgi:hypothetical protein